MCVPSEFILATQEWLRGAGASDRIDDREMSILAHWAGGGQLSGAKWADARALARCAAVDVLCARHKHGPPLTEEKGLKLPSPRSPIQSGQSDDEVTAIGAADRR